MTRNMFILAALVGGLLVGMLPSASPVAAATKGIWMSPTELRALPMSGASWENLLSAARGSLGSANISDQDNDHDVLTLATALVYARTGDATLRTKAASAIESAIGTEAGGRTLALGRNLTSYVIAADLIDYQGYDATADQRFRTWLRGVRTANLDGRTLISTHEERPNNWGTMAGAARVAADLYLGDTADLARAAQVFKGYLGDRTAHAGFQYGELSWQANPAAPVGINPAGATRDGRSIDGAMPDDLRRGCGYQWPPCATGYPWEGLQGATVQAELLTRAGYPAWEWQNRALLRAVKFLETLDRQYGNWWATSDDEWNVWLINDAYATTFKLESPTNPGKNMGWTDWTHARGTVSPPATTPTRTTAPSATPAQPTPPQPTPRATLTPTPPSALTPTPRSTLMPTSGPTPRTTTIKQMSFEGRNLSDSVTGADRVIGPIVLETGSPIANSVSARISADRSAYLQENFAPASNLDLRFMMRIDALPQSSARIAAIMYKGETIGNILLRSNGDLQLRIGSTTISGTSVRLQPGIVYTISMQQQAGSGNNGRLIAYATPLGQPLGQPFASTNGGTWTVPADLIRIGATSNSLAASTLR